MGRNRAEQEKRLAIEATTESLAGAHPLLSLPAEIAKSVPHAELPELYEAAKAALAACDRVDEIDDWADRAAALASYARQADDRELLNHATRIRDRAVRRLGQLLRKLDGRGRRKSGTPPTFASRGEAAESAGISRHKALTASRVASIPQDQFDALVESAQPPGASRLAEIGKTPRSREIDLKVTIIEEPPREVPYTVLESAGLERSVTIRPVYLPTDPKRSVTVQPVHETANIADDEAGERGVKETPPSPDDDQPAEAARLLKGAHMIFAAANALAGLPRPLVTTPGLQEAVGLIREALRMLGVVEAAEPDAAPPSESVQ